MENAKKRAIFMVGAKGGVGKTCCSRGILHAYRQAGLRVAAFDADGPVGQLLQYCGNRDENGKLTAEQKPAQSRGLL